MASFMDKLRDIISLRPALLASHGSKSTLHGNTEQPKRGKAPQGKRKGKAKYRIFTTAMD